MNVKFNDLPLVVRERFVQLTKMRPADTVVAYHPATGTRWLNWVGAIVLLPAAIATANALVESGQRMDPSRLQPMYGFFATEVFLLTACIVGIVYAFKWKAPPYTEGSYAFPGVLVRAKGDELLIVPLTQSGEPSVVHRYYNGGYTGSWVNIQGFEFRFGSKDGALNAANRLLRSRAIYAQAWQRGDQATIAQMDPFFECSLSNQWTAPPEQRGTGPQTPVVPKAARNARWLGALGFGLVTAAVTYLVVDNVFDDDRKALDGRSHPRTAKKKKTSDDD